MNFSEKQEILIMITRRSEHTIFSSSQIRISHSSNRSSLFFGHNLKVADDRQGSEGDVLHLSARKTKASAMFEGLEIRFLSLSREGL